MGRALSSAGPEHQAHSSWFRKTRRASTVQVLHSTSITKTRNRSDHGVKPLAPDARARDSSARTRAHLCWLSGTNITTMASYATIPAEAETEKPLLNRDVRVNLKTVIGGAAVASFVLGALAAAVVSGPARTNSAALYAHSGYQPSAHAPIFTQHEKTDRSATGGSSPGLRRL